MRVGVTGHLNLSDESVRLVTAALRDFLGAFDPASLVGVSCLARGSDSVFAEVVLELGGRLEVVLPSADYREAEIGPDQISQFDRLLTRASAVSTMPFDTADSDAYAAANEALLDSIDQLVAVWDGRPALDKGGTAAAVAGARARDIAVHVIWPDGARRV